MMPLGRSIWDLSLRLLGLGNSVADRALCNDWIDARTDAEWGSVAALRSSVSGLYHRGKKVRTAGAWTWLRNYLHELRLEDLCQTLPAEAQGSPLDGLGYRTSTLGFRALRKRAQLLAAADLRSRDREDDEFFPNASDTRDEQWMRASLPPTSDC